tara:strand:- start:627 stop:1235 length:609 start_codon:yes stop_codon:yes gene_type:complete
MKTFLTALASLGILSLVANAQQPIRLEPGDVKIRSTTVEVQKTPNFNAADVKSKSVPSPREWLELEVEFEVNGPSDEVVSDLLFRYYIAIADQNGSTRVLTGDVKHVNVFMGDKSYSAVYVSPSRLGEITGDFRRFQKSSIKAVGVEVIYNGVMVGLDSTMSGSSQQFWKAGTVSPEPGVLGKAETPFALLWLDRYADSEKN